MVFKWVWSYIKRYRFRMLLVLFLVVVCSALSMVSPYITGNIVDKVIIAKKTNLLVPYILTILMITFIRSILRYTFQIISEWVSQNCIFNIRKDLYNHLQNLDFEYFDRTKTGDIMTRMTADIDAVRHFIAWVIYNIFENLLIFSFAICMMFSINYKLTLIILAFTPPIAYFARKLSIEVKPTFTRIRNQFSKLNSVVQENISGNRVIKAFAKEDYEIEKFSKENKAFMDRNIESSNIWQKYLPILDSMSSFLSVVMLFAGGIMVMKKQLSMGQLVTFNSLIFALSNPLRMSGWLINDVQRFVASGEKIIDIQKVESKISNTELINCPTCFEGNLDFENVSFSYSYEQTLNNINLHVKKGETIAIIGPTGSGKTTLVNLICRFYDCTSGKILIDGIDIKDVDIKKLRDNIGVAMQDVFLFSDTIEGNIAYGEPEASNENVIKASELADAYDFIMNFPDGYDTIIGERGVGLSGGQKQRIALARALLKNPSILILDDTTSALDMETEYKIKKTLNNYRKGKTTFIIAQRISSVKNADEIIVLKDGNIVERGTHESLINAKGYYNNVFINQFGDFDSNSCLEVV